MKVNSKNVIYATRGKAAGHEYTSKAIFTSPHPTGSGPIVHTIGPQQTLTRKEHSNFMILELKLEKIYLIFLYEKYMPVSSRWQCINILASVTTREQVPLIGKLFLFSFLPY